MDERDSMEMLAAMRAKRLERHRQDVEYMQANHPDVAAFLTEFAEAFGKREVDYRVTLK